VWNAKAGYLVRIRERSAQRFNTLGVFVCGAAGLINHMVHAGHRETEQDEEFDTDTH
jgi:hypothetical protein